MKSLLCPSCENMIRMVVLAESELSAQESWVGDGGFWRESWVRVTIWVVRGLGFGNFGPSGFIVSFIAENLLLVLAFLVAFILVQLLSGFLIIMENLPPPNDNQNAPEEEPFMDQAPAAFDGFAPQWIDPEVNEEVMDDDDWDVEVEWLMAPVTPPRATMTVPSTYEVGGPSTAVIEGPSFPLPAPGLPVPPTVIEDLGTRLGNLEYRHGVLTRKMEEVSDVEVADSIAIGEIHPRVSTVAEQVQVMKSQTMQVVSRLEEIETRVQQVESRLDTYLSGQMTVPRQNVIVGSKERLTVLEKRLTGPPPGPQ
nr:hypothetical protein [Tanacetum cinerariifolium]